MASEDQAQPGLWARTRQQAYAEITSVAMDLFLANGFESTTIDEIVAAAGISRRSFFRYFGTKEDIVLNEVFSARSAMGGPGAFVPWGDTPMIGRVHG